VQNVILTFFTWPSRNPETEPQGRSREMIEKTVPDLQPENRHETGEGIPYL